MKSLITGASSGIGAAFAHRLAAAGSDLILVARRADRLAALADELRANRSIAIDVVPTDLSSAADLAKLEHYVRNLGPLDFLVNDAGFGTRGPFAEAGLSSQVAMVYVHNLAAMGLCHAALPGMIARKRGRIINVSSVAAFLPMSGNVVYSASKVFLVAFSQALQTEVGDQGIRVQALCPGFTYTGFHDTPEMHGFSRSHVPSFMWMSADEVAAISLAAIERGPVVVIPGFLNRLVNTVTRSGLVFALLRRIRGTRKL
jgi:uncharacterized protein